MNFESRSDKPDVHLHLRSLRGITWVFDEMVRIPGTSITVGLDALLGLLPGSGDVIGSVVSVYALFVARRLQAPSSVIARMSLNIVIDALVGVVPLVGDLFDIGWKANRRNVDLLEQFLASPARASRSSTAVVVAAAAAVLVALGAIAAGTIWLFTLIF